VATATSYVPNWKQSFGEEKVFHVYAGGVGQTYRLMLLVVESQGAARSVNWFVPVAKMCRSSIAVSDIAFFFPARFGWNGTALFTVWQPAERVWN